MSSPIHFINNTWQSGHGESFSSINPATGKTLWEGCAADQADVNRAMQAARAAAEPWASATLDRRRSFLEAFAVELRAHQDELAQTISRETGKPLWESHQEVGAMIGKIGLSVAAHEERRGEYASQTGGVTAAIRFKPQGVVAVFGPFNFPGHLPNGHIIPALLAGNTVLFKPSEMAPLVAEQTIKLWEATGLPAGVINLIQGGRQTGEALARHPDLDGLFFTGSVAVGIALHRQFAGQPQKILALELGGNNPLVVWDCADINAAAEVALRSAFLTAGQRCTCARRLILRSGNFGDRFLSRLIELTQALSIGPYTAQPEPFMGPVISDSAAQDALEAQKNLLALGGNPILPMKGLPDGPAFLSPGLMDVTSIQNRPDEEIFGPFLQIIRVDDFDQALKEAGHTRYGLAAGLLSDDKALYERFYRAVRAGVINWNRPTTGASGRLPFGGAGLSGNHRPSGYYAADYCSDPVASLESEILTPPQS